MSATMKIRAYRVLNVNDTVRVRLTPKGEEIAKAHELYGLTGSGKDGEWQIWELMATFGPHLHMGAEALFVGNEIEIQDTETK